MIRTIFLCDRCRTEFELSNLDGPDHEVYTVEIKSEFASAPIRKQICGDCYNKLNLFLQKQEPQERKE